jgi:hypothetical protein
MKLIRAPEIAPPHWYSEASDILFLAGGITGCPKWDLEVIDGLKDQEDLLVITPRRLDFDTSNPNMALEQIRWEFRDLNNASVISFWFPEETLCPITLLELGKALQKSVAQSSMFSALDVVIGCHPNYARRVDVVEQTRLMNPKIRIVDSIPKLIDEIKRTIW